MSRVREGSTAAARVTMCYGVPRRRLDASPCGERAKIVITDAEGTQGGSPKGDSIVINDDFASNSTTLSYDDNGSLTDDGIFKFVYDAWNRMVKVQRRPEPTETKSLVATYAYDGANRRASKAVTNTGVETYPNDGGETTVHFYYGTVAQPPSAVSPPWSIFETRNGSNQTTWQHLWGTQYIDELIWLDKNGDPTIGNDTDPDGTAGEGAESPVDHRYFAHQDRNWNVVALIDYGAGANGRVLERYSQPLYTSGVVLTGEVSGNEQGVALSRSRVGNVFAHQGLVRTLDYLDNRARILHVATMAFFQADPARFADGLNPRQAVRGNPLLFTDPMGLCAGAGCRPTEPSTIICDEPPPPPPPPPGEPCCEEREENQNCATDEGMWVAEWCLQRERYCNWADDVNFIQRICMNCAGLTAKTNIPPGKSDKWKHCFVGCFIGSCCGAQAACAAGKWKECADLTDCNPNTHFEERDAVVTCECGEYGAGIGGCGSFSEFKCKQECDRRFP